MEVIAETEEKSRIEQIIEFAKTLDESGQEAFVNVMIGFNMAQNLKLAEYNTTTANFK